MGQRGGFPQKLYLQMRHREIAPALSARQNSSGQYAVCPAPPGVGRKEIFSLNQGRGVDFLVDPVFISFPLLGIPVKAGRVYGVSATATARD